MKFFNFREFIVVIIKRVEQIKTFGAKIIDFSSFLLDFERFSRDFYSRNDVFRRFGVFYQHCLREAVSESMSRFATYTFQTHNQLGAYGIRETRPSESQIIPNYRP